jgi:uncharacterized membrane protein YkvA (DUF1232 family)
MANKRDLIANQNTGLFQNLATHLKLIMRLIGDRRVNFFLKLLPIGAAVYVISPIDLLPGAVFPVVGALDDAVAIWLGTSLFISLCPDDVVQEHMNALNKVVNATWRDAEEGTTPENIVDAESPHEPQ